MKTVFRKYIDYDSGLPYWVNPRTGFSTWTKPLCFGKEDVDTEAIPMPDMSINYSLFCSNCAIGTGKIWCYICEELQCSLCFTSFHAKGSFTTHLFTELDMCTLCTFQLASFHCTTCSEPFCDNCWAHSHGRGIMSTHQYVATNCIKLICISKNDCVLDLLDL